MKTKLFTSAGPNDVWNQDAIWSVIRYDEGVDASGGAAKIRVRCLDGVSIDAELVPGRQLTLRTPTRGVIITSMGGAIVGKVSIGDGDITDASVTGTVSVIDGGRARTLAGSAFYGLPVCGGTGGTYAHVQLINPVASLKNVFVEQLYPYSATANAAGFSLRRTLTAFGAAPTYAISKDFANTNPSVAEMRAGNNAAPQGTAQIGTIFRAVPLKLTEPIRLGPGQGLIVMSGTLGEDAACNFEFFEEAF